GQRGPGDAAVLVPKPGGKRGFAVATGLNPRYSWIDPAAMAEASLDEAMRNVVCRGGDPTHTAILDNYCWGNCDKPEQLGALVRATEALCAMALEFRTPFVSGKDSLHNEFRVGDETIAIPGCILVTALAIVPDVHLVPESCFVAADAPVYLVGRTYRELGGSLWYAMHGALGNAVPRAVVLDSVRNLRVLAEAIQQGWVRAAHDPSEGGIAVAAAEMAFGGELGITLDLGNLDVEEGMRDDEVLFSESLGRVLVEVRPEHEEDFVRFLRSLQVSARKIGVTSAQRRYRAEGRQGDQLFDLDLDDCERAFREPLEHGPIAAARAAKSKMSEEAGQ
ncbi:MAG TPA: AIR synthase-related protein, partial [Planctomycetota bacterium]|nr:AIR synthase-related protein [Planctomycetota bacterium]